MPYRFARPSGGISAVVTTFTCLALTLLTPVAGGCAAKKPPAPPLDFAREMPAGQKALRKVSPAEYPDFSAMQARPADLLQSIDHSLAYLSRPSSAAFFPYLDITHDRARATLAAMRELVARGPTVDWNVEVRQRFDVYKSVGAPALNDGGYTGKVLFTGYFTPIYDASPTRQGPYQWPLYRRPADLPPGGGGPGADPASESSQAGGVYLTREQIERGGALRGQELVWLTSRWEAYVVTVQGSALLRLPDGRQIEVGYAGTNGHPYVSPGKRMLDDGVITKDQLSFTGLRRYFDANPAAMDKYLWANPRTTFFAETTGQGIRGSLNVPVTPFATIATDKDVYPRAMAAFVVAPVVQPGAADGRASAYRGFMLDQDTGGAIRAAGRCDLYMGVGPAAEQLAGHQLHAGELYYVALKPEHVPAYLRPTERAAVGGR